MGTVADLSPEQVTGARWTPQRRYRRASCSTSAHGLPTIRREHRSRRLPERNQERCRPRPRWPRVAPDVAPGSTAPRGGPGGAPASAETMLHAGRGLGPPWASPSPVPVPGRTGPPNPRAERVGLGGRSVVQPGFPARSPAAFGGRTRVVRRRPGPAALPRAARADAAAAGQNSAPPPRHADPPARPGVTRTRRRAHLGQYGSDQDGPFFGPTANWSAGADQFRVADRCRPTRGDAAYEPAATSRRAAAGGRAGSWHLGSARDLDAGHLWSGISHGAPAPAQWRARGPDMSALERASSSKRLVTEAGRVTTSCGSSRMTACQRASIVLVGGGPASARRVPF